MPTDKVVCQPTDELKHPRVTEKRETEDRQEKEKEREEKKPERLTKKKKVREKQRNSSYVCRPCVEGKWRWEEHALHV